MTTLLKRMHEVLRVRNWTAREWSRQAGLREETHVGTIMRRLKKMPHGDALKGEVATYVKLASAARVSLDWLLLGEGQMELLDGNSAAEGGSAGHAAQAKAPILIVGSDDAYPSRPAVLVAAQLLGAFSPQAIRSVAAMNPEQDPGVRYWLQMLGIEHDRLAGQTPPEPAVDRSKK